MKMLYFSIAAISLTSSQALISDHARSLHPPNAGLTISQQQQGVNLTQFSTWPPVIRDCPQPHTNSLKTTLESVRARIDIAIAELRVRIIRDDNEKRRIASFKSYQYLSFLLERLIDIARLRPINGLKPHKEILQTPHLACVSPETSQKYAWLDLGYDPWTVCRTEPFPRTFLAPYSAYIFLCPNFFSFPREGITDRCPAVVDNRFVGDEGEYYADTQLYGIIAQLYRFYLRGQAIDMPPRDWNQCILDLTPRESVLGPKNVALWTFFVHNKCSVFPQRG